MHFLANPSLGSHSDLIHPKNRYYQPPVRLILFSRYQAESDFQWKEFTPAETGLELMQFLINTRNLPEHGFREITRLARKIKGIKFTYSSIEQIEKPIKDILNSL